MSHGILASVSDLSEIRDAARAYRVGLADQCGADLKQAALDKIAASGERYPAQSHRGVAPTKTDRG